MARISLEDKLLARSEFEDFKPQLRRPKRKRRIGFKAGCCLFFLIILIFFLLIATAAIAKTGIIEIPVFTRLFYRLPQPSRTIEISDLGKFFQPFGVQFLPDDSLAVEFTEEQLTFLLRQYLTGKKDSYFADNAQAVIINQEIEFFGLLIKPISANLTLKLRPKLIDNNLALDLAGAKIGNLDLPVPVADWLIDKLFQNKLAEFKQKIKDFQLTDLNLSEGKLNFTVKIDLALAAEKIKESLEKLKTNQ